MKYNNCIDLIKYFEGLSLTPYICPGGHWTIGYGSAEPLAKAELIDDISEPEAEYLLMDDIAEAQMALRNLTDIDKLSVNQFHALTSFIFNVGRNNYKRSTLRKKLSEGDFEGASKEFGRWVYTTKKIHKVKLKGLVKRREAEKELFDKK